MSALIDTLVDKGTSDVALDLAKKRFARLQGKRSALALKSSSLPLSDGSLDLFKKQYVANVTLLPEQFFALHTRENAKGHVRGRGEKLLYYYLIEDAIVVLRRYPPSSVLYQRDLEWVTDGHTGAVSLAYACDALGVDYTATRAYLLALTNMYRRRTVSPSLPLPAPVAQEGALP